MPRFSARPSSNIYAYPLTLRGESEARTDYIKITAFDYIPPQQNATPNLRDLGRLRRSDESLYSTRNQKGTVYITMPQQLPANGNTAGWDSNNYGPIQAAGAGLYNAATNTSPQDIGNALGNAIQNPLGTIGNITSSIINNLNANSTQYTDLAKAVFGGFAINALTGSNALGSFLGRNNGVIFNQNVELLFNQVLLRPAFELAFQVNPRSPEEAQEVKRMVRFLKREMSPRQNNTFSGTTGNVAGSFFIGTPSVFKIEYKSGQREHPFLNRYKICAMQSIALDFTSAGTYATYPDGTPTSMTLVMSMQELTPIYQEDYDGVNVDSGIGF